MNSLNTFSFDEELDDSDTLPAAAQKEKTAKNTSADRPDAGRTAPKNAVSGMEALHLCHCFQNMIIIMRTQFVPVLYPMNRVDAPRSSKRPEMDDVSRPREEEPALPQTPRFSFNDPRIESPEFQRKAELN